MLEKIQMAPMLQLGIISFKLFLSAFWARKGPATPEVDHDVNPFPFWIKFTRFHLPRRDQTKGHLKKFCISHNANSYHFSNSPSNHYPPEIARNRKQ
jgi:hypothetical protein